MLEKYTCETLRLTDDWWRGAIIYQIYPRSYLDTDGDGVGDMKGIVGKLDYIAGLDARGFIIGPILAYELNLGFIPIRKAGKLPYKRLSQSYELEYGTATVEIHEDACKPGDRVVIIDDLIATGGTMMAGKILLERLGAVVVEGAAIVDLPELGGSKLLRDGGLELYTATSFEGH